MITPGNWVPRITDFGVDVIEEKTGFGICEIGTRYDMRDADYPEDQAEANAKLIAAAPDLLEACLQLINAPHQEHFTSRLNEEELKGIVMIKVAIKKATE